MTCDSKMTAPAFGMACQIMAPVVIRKGRLAAVLLHYGTEQSCTYDGNSNQVSSYNSLPGKVMNSQQATMML